MNLQRRWQLTRDLQSQIRQSQRYQLEVNTKTHPSQRLYTNDTCLERESRFSPGKRHWIHQALQGPMLRGSWSPQPAQSGLHALLGLFCLQDCCFFFNVILFWRQEKQYQNLFYEINKRNKILGRTANINTSSNVRVITIMGYIYICL